MKWLEVRRHTFTKKGPARGRGSHLSADGVALARLIGETTGPFAYVLTSSVPRKLETALAMGFSVDDAIDMPGGYIPRVVDHHDQWDWDLPYVSYAAKLAEDADLAEAAQQTKEIWTQALEMVPEGGQALIVSHGGSIELGLVACLPEADHRSWGAPFAHGDGVRLSFADSVFTAAEFVRSPR